MDEAGKNINLILYPWLCVSLISRVTVGSTHEALLSGKTKQNKTLEHPSWKLRQTRFSRGNHFCSRDRPTGKLQMDWEARPCKDIIRDVCCQHLSFQVKTTLWGNMHLPCECHSFPTRMGASGEFGREINKCGFKILHHGVSPHLGHPNESGTIFQIINVLCSKITRG